MNCKEKKNELKNSPHLVDRGLFYAAHINKLFLPCIIESFMISLMDQVASQNAADMIYTRALPLRVMSALWSCYFQLCFCLLNG